MNAPDLLDNVEKIVTPVVESLGMELIEREFVLDQGRWVLRLYIDREGTGVNISDCQTVSRALEPVLDVEDIIPQRYALEVSSPGIERPLRRPKDFEKFEGSLVKLDTIEKINERHHFSGILKGLRDNQIVIQEGEQEWVIPLELLKKAKIRSEVWQRQQKHGKRK